MKFIDEIIVLVMNVVFAFIKSIGKWLLPNEKKDFSGQVVVITGSAQGIGKEMAMLFRKLGAKLALIDIDQSLNQELVEHLRSDPKDPDVIAYKCDLTNESEIEDIAGQILLDFGQVDILINNAGFVKCVPLLELSKQDIKRTFEVNVFAQFWLIRQFLPAMIDRKSGHIVAIGSIAGLTGNTNLVDYSASKHAVVGMMTALDYELTSLKYDFIKLTTICPLSIATGMFKRLKTRFNFLLPILSPVQVAHGVIDAIRNERFLITIPRYAYLFMLVEKMMPQEVNRYLRKYLQYEAGRHS